MVVGSILSIPMVVPGELATDCATAASNYFYVYNTSKIDRPNSHQTKIIKFDFMKLKNAKK